MSRIRDFTRSHTMWLSLAMGFMVIPWAFAQILGHMGLWDWLVSLRASGSVGAFWAAYFTSRVLFGIALFVTWWGLECLAVKMKIFIYDFGFFINYLPVPNFTTWSKTEIMFFVFSILLINFSASDVAIALYTWAPPPYFG